MVGGRRGGGAEAEIEVGTGGTGGIRMVKRGHINDIDLERGLITDQRTGQERGTRIEGNGRAATIEVEMTIGSHFGNGSGVTLRIHIGDGGLPEIKVTIIEDDEDVFR